MSLKLQEANLIGQDRIRDIQMQISKIVTSSRTNNKCKSCRISDRCLPGQIDKKILKQLPQLSFKSHILEPGQHLFRQGDLLDCLYTIRSGLLKSYTIQEDGREYTMGFHLPPDLFGWEAIDKNQLSVSVIAIESSNICEIPINQLDDLFREIPKISSQMLQLVSQRIHHDNTAMLRASAEQRVAHFLLQLANRYTQLGYPYYLCKLMMTHQDIANYLRIAPETISRIFHSFKAKGMITISRKSIYLNEMEKLEAIARQ